MDEENEQKVELVFVRHDGSADSETVSSRLDEHFQEGSKE